MIAECQCQNSLDGNVCDVTTGQCGLCKSGFFGNFCNLRASQGIKTKMFGKVHLQLF